MSAKAKCNVTVPYFLILPYMFHTIDRKWYDHVFNVNHIVRIRSADTETCTLTLTDGSSVNIKMPLEDMLKIVEAVNYLSTPPPSTCEHDLDTAISHIIRAAKERYEDELIRTENKRRNRSG